MNKNTNPDPNKSFVYEGRKTSEISFPLGGIGTGCIGLAGNGRLIDWEIFNRPNKNSDNGFSFFAIKAEREGQVKTARVLHGDLQPPFIGKGGGKDNLTGYGFGVDRESLAGMPHFRKTSFQGQFPFANVRFEDDEVPLDVSLEAFNPFIPLDDDNSSLPVAILTYEVTNRSDEELDISVVGNLTNPFFHESVNSFTDSGIMRGIKLHQRHFQPHEPQYGDLTIATDAEDISWQTYWYRGSWFDNLTVFWKDFTSPGKFAERYYDAPREIDWANLVASQKKVLRDVCLLSAHQTLAPGESGRFRFVISWSFPNYENYWNPGSDTRPVWKNYYATRFSDSTASAEYTFRHFNQLYGETKRFHDALFQSSFPDYVIDAISSNISTLKSPTCLRLTDGTFYGFEGCFSQEGCCEGSCTHVWNYDQATPFLFPKLERSMHSIYYKYNAYDEHGKMAFRTMLPPENTKTVKSINNGAFTPAVDGQMGSIVRVYRDWKLSANTEWLRTIWPDVKKALEYAWSPHNEYGWDRDQDGVLEGRQHHTLDVEMFGPNSYLTGMYLAALLAASHMADALGDKAGEKYKQLYEKGRAWVNEHLFNGQYFHQLLDLKDERYPIDPVLGEIKYQIGEGCHIDQVIGQWHAHLSGLGYIFDQDKVVTSLKSIHTNNFRSMRNYPNACRLFAIDDEKGTLICTWPKGNSPIVPAPYADETFHGCEYQAASHMIMEGLVQEGLEMVKAVRDRYDGEKRNPWSEMESGSNYARSLSSYSLLIALSGFQFDMIERSIGFYPKLNRQSFRSFWSVDGAWGSFIHDGELRLEVEKGSLTLETFASDYFMDKRVQAVYVDGSQVDYTVDRDVITFGSSVTIDRSLVIEFAR